MLALSAVLIKGYDGGGSGHVPSLFDYGAFCGAAAIVIGLVGVAACFVDSLQGMITLALDGLSAFFVLAGGIVSFCPLPQVLNLIKLLLGICSHDKSR